MTEIKQPEFIIQRLYTKDVSFESPSAPAIFKENLQPIVKLNIQVGHTLLEENIYESTLAITVTAEVDDRSIFLVEVKQAGIFTIKHLPEDNLDVALQVTCPTILFPYLRETVSDLVARGGFQHFYLAPVNFEALYLSNLEKQNEAQNSSH